MFIMEATPTPQRILPPATADAISHKFSIGGHEYYAIISKYQEGHPAMLDVKGAKVVLLMDCLMGSLLRRRWLYSMAFPWMKLCLNGKENDLSLLDLPKIWTIPL